MDEPPKPEGVPETYAEFTAPEGVTLDKEAIAEATKVFKEAKLTQAQAQAIVEAQAKREAAIIQRGNDAYVATRKEWTDAAKSEWGTKLPEMRTTISRALGTLGLSEAQTADFRTAMNITGAGDNPAFIRVFHALAAKIGEGKSVSPGGPAAQAVPNTQPRTAGGALYPHLPQ